MNEDHYTDRAGDPLPLRATEFEEYDHDSPINDEYATGVMQKAMGMYTHVPRPCSCGQCPGCGRPLFPWWDRFRQWPYWHPFPHYVYQGA